MWCRQVSPPLTQMEHELGDMYLLLSCWSWLLCSSRGRIIYEVSKDNFNYVLFFLPYTL